MQSHAESDGMEMQCLLHCLQYIWLLKMRCIHLQSNQCWNQYMKGTIWYFFIHAHRYCRSTLFSLFSTNLCSHACIMAFVLPPIPQTPQAQLVALSLSGIASCINCGASSFVGVDSLEKMRFSFSLGHPLFKKLLLLLPPIHLQPSSNLSRRGKKQARGVVHLAN